MAMLITCEQDLVVGPSLAARVSFPNGKTTVDSVPLNLPSARELNHQRSYGKYQYQ